MQHGVTYLTAMRDLSASRLCQLPLDCPVVQPFSLLLHTYHRSFTQSRLQDWNPLLLCHFIGSMSNWVFVVFDSLTLRLINWLSGGESAVKLNVQGEPFFTIIQGSPCLVRLPDITMFPGWTANLLADSHFLRDLKVRGFHAPVRFL